MKFTYLTLTLLVPSLVFGMELETTQPIAPRQNDMVLDLEAASNDASKLTADLVQSIRAGRVSHINQLLTKRTNRSGDTQVGATRRMDQLVSALGYSQGELELQQQQMSQKMFDKFLARYKQAATPLLLTALSLVNIGTNAYSFANPTPTAVQQSVSSFGINMAAAGSAALGFGYESFLQLRKGYTDHRQKKLVEQLKNSQLLLQLLHENAMKDGVITVQEQAGINAVQLEQAQLEVEVAKATINAQIAATEADANNSQAPQALAFAAPVVNATTAHDNNQPTAATTPGNDI